MTDEEIREIVAQLDAAIPREGAVVEIEQDEEMYEIRAVAVVANRLGYLRLGIEFLKAAIAPPSDPEGKLSISINTGDVENLLQADSLGIVGLIREEAPQSEYQPDKADKVLNTLGIGCGILCFLLMGLVAMGL